MDCADSTRILDVGSTIFDVDLAVFDCIRVWILYILISSMCFVSLSSTSLV